MKTDRSAAYIGTVMNALMVERMRLVLDPAFFARAFTLVREEAVLNLRKLVLC